MTDNTKNAAPQPPLFAKSDVDTVPLVDYVRWFIDCNHPRHDFIQLPPIQRGAVWKVAQVERLWDSLRITKQIDAAGIHDCFGQDAFDLDLQHEPWSRLV